MNHKIDTDDRNPEFCRGEDRVGGTPNPAKDLKLLEILIDKIIERLEDNTCQPKIQDALKAIQLKQKVAPVSEAEKTFWDLIEEIKSSELPEPYPESIKPNSLESQILKTILGLKDQVKNGILPVKTITDAFNQERSKKSQSQDPAFRLTYPRIGRILSVMGFRKARTGRGASAIVWDEDFIFSLSPPQETESAIGDDSKEIKPSSEPSETSEPSEPSQTKEVPSSFKGDCQNASPGQVENPALRQAQGGERLVLREVEGSRTTRGGGEVKPNLFLCPPSLWSHRR
jgi:hypothetical protein